MSTNKTVVLTYEGLKKYEEELEYLKSVKRLEIAEKIKLARSYGDLSENSEYDEAKNEQAFIEGRIAQIEQMLRNAKVIDEEDVSTESVNIGTTVRVLDKEFNEEDEYTLVSSAEADPMHNKISDESPIGRALMGHKVGDEVEVEIPDGIVRLKILDIKK
ncbi:transcription elongation factor GreA [Calorimonas adulescens]|uniref:Transcription elongation factor GreA n=1 Tax=Calorimonas adulescens TaxID=2606906 RepID=A0A5D8QB01_9THEO|nr:transcription elongation factor GreA [Calorimonas adulescens]TZE81567.1 transcription elongation factor GreA [Calorimonas adulescens]